jgi:post-segregation antitoxin (ccd killing protein)
MKTVYIEKETHKALKQAAQDADVTISEIADTVIRKSLKMKPSKKWKKP